MTKSHQLGLTEKEFGIVTRILSAHLSGRPVYAFGSRATGKAGRRSDLDLAVGGESPLSLRQRALLKEEFAESDLPIFVDVLDLQAITADFHHRIQRDFVVVQDDAAASQVAA